jgi:DNA-binding MarR family transcriptional regulator
MKSTGQLSQGADPFGFWGAPQPAAAPGSGSRGKRAAERKADAVGDLMLEVAQFFFRLRALGQHTGLVNGWGAAAFGFMRSLAVMGPLTVPQIAQMRPTSRQRMQRLADELAAEGLVELVENPKHLRSKLVRLTAKGNARYRALNNQFRLIATTIGADLSATTFREVTEAVRVLSEETKALSESGRLARTAGLAASE